MRKEKLKELENYIREFQIVDRKQLNEEPRFLSITRSSYELQCGKTIIREQVIKQGNSGSASIILPITEEGNVILVVQPRVLNYNGIGVELPAGYVEPGEDAILSAKRELEEETGYQSKKFIKLASYYQDQGCMEAYNHSFLALDCKKVTEQYLDQDEYIRYFECTYEEALELMELGYINDANSILTLEKSKQYIRR